MVLDDKGNLKNRYTYGPGTDHLLVDEVFDAAGQESQTLWAVTDHLGSVHNLLDDDTTSLVEHRDYDAFGNLAQVLDASGNDVNLDDLATDFAYAGRTWDDDVGLYYNRARWYDSGLGKFISEDPIGFSGGDANLYRYAGNDPVNFRDPSGNNPDLDAIGIGNGNDFNNSNGGSNGGSSTGFGFSIIPNQPVEGSSPRERQERAARLQAQAIAEAGERSRISQTASSIFESFNPLASSAVNASVGLFGISGEAIGATNISHNLLQLFGTRQENLARREREFRRRQHREALRESALAGNLDDAAFRAADRALDRQIRESDFSLGPQLVADTLQRFEDDIILNMTGLTRQEAALGILNRVYVATGQPTITLSSPLVQTPGFQIIESGIGAAFNPLTYSPIIVSQSSRLSSLRIFNNSPNPGRYNRYAIDPYNLSPNRGFVSLDSLEASARQLRNQVEVGTAHTNFAIRQGSLRIQVRGNEPIGNLEINAAQVLTHRGYDVILRTPVGTRAAGGTSDLLLNGVRADIFAPITSNADRVVGAVFKKNSQLPGGGTVVLDLRNTPLTARDFSNIGARLRGAADKKGVQLNIRRVEIIE